MNKLWPDLTFQVHASIERRWKVNQICYWNGALTVYDLINLIIYWVQLFDNIFSAPVLSSSTICTPKAVHDVNVASCHEGARCHTSQIISAYSYSKHNHTLFTFSKFVIFTGGMGVKLCFVTILHSPHTCSILWFSTLHYPSCPIFTIYENFLESFQFGLLCIAGV